LKHKATATFTPHPKHKNISLIAHMKAIKYKIKK